MRLDRTLSNLGVGSRQEVQRLVRAGSVRVLGDVVRDPARHVVDAATVTIDGAPLDHLHGILVALHKPLGYVCSRNDGEGPTVFDLLPAAWSARRPRPEPVGRLDRDTTGLLLVTDDHALLHRLTSPRHHVPRTYRATLARPITPDVVATFASGELLLRSEARPCLPASVDVVDERTVMVTLTEGRYHQVRRMFAACGNHVEALHRVAIGGWTLGDLTEAEWRDVDRSEVE